MDGKAIAQGLITLIVVAFIVGIVVAGVGGWLISHISINWH